MRLSVNLATRPFVELRPLFFRLRLLMTLLAVLGLGLAIAAHVVSAKAERQQIELDKLRNLTIATQNAKLRTEQRLRQPGNVAVLDRAHFLNTIFLRKSFSWTAVMMDLEDVLPAGVQVTSIEPAVTADGAVLIRLRVAGERDRAVQLVRNLERSHRFLNPRLGSESAQTKENTGAARPLQPVIPTGPPGVEFEILANYNPLPPGESYHAGHGRATVTVPVTGTAARPALAAAEPVTPVKTVVEMSMADRIAAAAAANIAAAERSRSTHPGADVAAGAPVRPVRNNPRIGGGFMGAGVPIGPQRAQDGRLPPSVPPGGGVQ